MRQGIEQILSPKQQRQPLSSLLSLSFFNGVEDMLVQALENMGHILKAAGGSYRDVIKTTILLKVRIVILPHGMACVFCKLVYYTMLSITD